MTQRPHHPVWLVFALAVAAGCQSQANARTPDASTVAGIIDSLEVSNRETERLLDSARGQLDSALQSMVDIATLTDRLAGAPVTVTSRTGDEIERVRREDFTSLRNRSLARLETIRRRLAGVDASLARVRDTSMTLRAEVTRLTRTITSLTRATNAHESRLRQLTQRLQETQRERDEAIASSRKFQQQADTLREVLAYTVEKTRARDDSVFVLIGDEATLRQLGVANRSGGFAGIRSSLTLRGDFPRDAFTLMSRSGDTTLPMPRADRQYRLISAQRPGCYEWQTQDSLPVLHVRNSDCFWESSRYLVIEERR